MESKRTKGLQVNFSKVFEPSYRPVFLPQSFTETQLRLSQSRKMIRSLNSLLQFSHYLKTSSRWKNAFLRRLIFVSTFLKSKFSISVRVLALKKSLFRIGSPRFYKNYAQELSTNHWPKCLQK